MRLERERRAWEARRQVYQKEIERLQPTLEPARTSPAAMNDQHTRISEVHQPAGELVNALQRENDRLRAAWQEMADRTAAADRSESLETKLAETLNERHQLEHNLSESKMRPCESGSSTKQLWRNSMLGCRRPRGPTVRGRMPITHPIGSPPHWI